jgi:hypothetical protein
MSETRIPDAELRLPDGAHLMLYRNEGWTDDNTKVRIVGNRMVALKPGQPRIVVFVYEDEGGRVIRMIYDSHTQKHGEHTNLPLPPDVKYFLYTIDDEGERTRYLNWYGMFAARQDTFPVDFNEDHKVNWHEEARARAVQDADESKLTGSEREAFIQSREQQHYAELEKIGTENIE